LNESILESLKFEEIENEINKQNASWKAKDYDFLELPESELVKRLGVNVDFEKLEKHRSQPKPDIVRIMADFAGLEHKDGIYPLSDKLADIIQTGSLHIPKVVDWRDRKGRNNVTSVKDQKYCGSCVAFGTSATLESMVLIEHNVSLDLSEAELLFCGGGSCGGWWPDNAIAYLRSRGISHESCFPYFDFNMACNTCAERDGEAVQAKYFVILNDINSRKQYIRNIGPVICVFDVYQDFYAYHTGVYSHVTGVLKGSHCVEVVGFDEDAGAWICKNSWGTGWGYGGFFLIAYGQCGIDSTYPFWGIGGTKWYI
jgi:C1A family cysteine protease